MRPGALVALPLIASVLAASCKEEQPPPPTVVAPQATPPPSAVSGKSAPDCITPFSTQGATGDLRLGGRTFKRTGTVLSVASADPNRRAVLGVIANLKEATPENKVNLEVFSKFFREEKAEALLVDGDSGDETNEIEASLEAVARLDFPTFVVPGNREPRADYQAAIARVIARHANMVNMTQTRLVNFDSVSVVSLPGYYDKHFLNAGEGGCQYFKEDVDALAPIVAAASGPVLLLSHAEPRGTGHEAIDAFMDGNAGDAYLASFIRGHAVPFGVFANMQEAGGHATDIDSNVIHAGDVRDHLYLNVGAADATEWAMNDNTRSHGMANVVIVEGRKASFKVFRASEQAPANLPTVKATSAKVPPAKERK